MPKRRRWLWRLRILSPHRDRSMDGPGGYAFMWGTTERDHVDAPISRRGRVLFWGIVVAIVVGGALLIVYSR